MHVTEEEHASMSTEVIDVFAVRQVSPELLVFGGFPYLATRISPTLYHIILLPRSKSLELCQAAAGCQAYLNQLPTCLVLDHDLCYYYTGSAAPTKSAHPPSGGFLVYGRLRAFREFPVTPELRARREALSSFGKQSGGFLFGDLTKGGRAASEDELRRLAGKQKNGVPAGLVRCSQCGEWKGECLDPSPSFKNKVMSVHCTCDNNNLCAGCGRLLHARKLNANFFDEADGEIWHVPGFCAFGHRCGEGLQ